MKIWGHIKIRQATPIFLYGLEGSEANGACISVVIYAIIMQSFADKLEYVTFA